MRFCLLVAFLLVTKIGFCQVSMIKWNFDAVKTNENEYDLVFTADVEKGWYMYSQYLESDEGPIKTSFEYEPNQNFELVGKNEEKGTRKELFDELFQMKLIKFCGKVKFIQKIKTKGNINNIKGTATAMTCDEEKCLPPVDVDFDITLPK